ncbi:MAG: LamG domain-containing protein, partial [Candidatus Omnitrophica bacterium]|nr:LamG domain-containing protein [Candidatus Omnitrophota bacterium]
ERTVAIWFRVEDPSINTRKQVIYEEGGAGRGLNIYVYDGKLYVGGWNALGGSNWQGTYLSTAIEGGGWHHVALTLKGGETISADALKGYLDGAEFGRGEGSQLWEHKALIGLGGMNNATKFHDEAIMDGNGNYLKGGINGVEIYNRVLSTREVGILTRLTAPPDVTPPAGSIVINQGALYATQHEVILTLQASDSESGIDKMSFSADGINWSIPEDYSEEKIFTLPEGDGNKKVFVKYYDKAKNTQVVESQTIMLDTTNPDGWLWVVGSSSGYTKAPTVTVTLMVSDPVPAGSSGASGIDQIRFSVTSDGESENWQDWENFVEEKQLALPAGDGLKVVKYEVRDKAGNTKVIESTKNITFDGSAPEGSVLINDGDQYTRDRNINLTIFAEDYLSGLSGKMRLGTKFAEEGSSWVWQAWEDFKASQSFILPDQDGLIQVQMQTYDILGNTTDGIFDDIRLDRLPPAGTITVNGGVEFIGQTGVTLNLSAADGLLGSQLDQMSFSSDGIIWEEPEPYAQTKDWNFSAGDGQKKVYVKYSDRAGNWSEAIFVKVGLDTTSPTGSININSGATHTKTANVKLTLTSDDGTGSGKDKMSFSTDGINWSDPPESYSDSKDFDLPAGDGNKTVYVRFYDKLGHVSQVYQQSITLDTIAPAIVLTSPTLTKSAAYTLTYTENGVAKSENINLTTEGDNAIVRTFTDAAGNKTDVTWNVTLDTKAPVVELTSSLLVKQAAYTLKYKVDAGTEQTESLTLVEGINAIVRSFTDAAGNKTDVTWNVTLDTKAPVVELTSSLLVKQAAYTLKYKVDGGTEQTESLTLVEGVNAIARTFTDAAGNKTD